MGLNRFLFVARWKQRILDVLLFAGEIDPNSRRWVLNFSYISILMAEAHDFRIWIVDGIAVAALST